jgi:hypothetical protein
MQMASNESSTQNTTATMIRATADISMYVYCGLGYNNGQAVPHCNGHNSQNTLM